MAIIKKQYYDIKFPFTISKQDGFFVDLNSDLKDKVASEIAHVILTQKGTRLKMPDFGTDLIKYIFEPSDTLEWNTVESEIRRAVGQYVSNATIQSVEVKRDESEDHSIYLDIMYAIKKGNKEENNRAVIKLQ